MKTYIYEEKHRLAKRKYYADNITVLRQKALDRYHKNKTRNREWKKNNPEKVKEYSRRSYQKNRLYRIHRIKEHMKILREELMNILGQHDCRNCGFSDTRALQFDHINGGGTKQYINIFHRSRNSMWSFYTKHPEMARKHLQVLCANCNWIKVDTAHERENKRRVST